jgi:hypothetical protein
MPGTQNLQKLVTLNKLRYADRPILRMTLSRSLGAERWQS